MNKKILLIIIGLYLIISVNASGSFIGTWDTDFYISENISDGNNHNPDGVGKITGTLTGISNGSNIAITGTIYINIMNGTNILDELVLPYLNTSTMYLFVPTIGANYNVGNQGGSNYPFINPTSKAYKLNESIISISGTTLSITVDQNYVDTWTPINETYYEISLGNTLTASSNTGSIPVQGQYKFTGCITQASQTSTQQVLYVTNYNISVWDSGYTTTTTTTSTTTTTIYSDNTINLNVSLDVGTSGENPSYYSLTLFECSLNSYFNENRENRFNLCNWESYGYFGSENILIENLSVDKNYYVEAYKNNMFYSEYFVFSPTDYNGTNTYAYADLKLHYTQIPYTIAFANIDDTTEILENVEYHFYDDWLEIASGTSPLDYINFTHTKNSFTITYSAVKDNYLSIFKGEKSFLVYPVTKYKLLLTPSNITYYTVEGRVYKNDILQNDVLVVGDCNGIDEWRLTRTQPDGTYTLEDLPDKSTCRIFTNDKTGIVNDEKTIYINGTHLTGVNLYMTDSSYNNSMNFLVKRQVKINEWVAIDNVLVSISGNCNFKDEQQKRTDTNGLVSFDVLHSDCSYVVKVNEDGYINGITDNYQTSYLSGDKALHLLKILPLNGITYDNYYWCLSPYSNLTVAEKSTGNFIEFKTCNADKRCTLNNLYPETVYCFECISPDGVKANNCEKTPPQDGTGGTSGSGSSDGEDDAGDGSGGGNMRMPPIQGESSSINSLWDIILDSIDVFKIMVYMIIGIMFLKIGSGLLNSLGGK